MKQNVLNVLNEVFIYFKGLFLSVAAMFVASAVGWITFLDAGPQDRLLAPAVAAFAIWTIFFIMKKIVWVVILWFAAWGIFGLLIGLMLLGNIALQVAIFTLSSLPFGTVQFVSDDGAYFVVGAILALVGIISDDAMRVSLKEALSEDDEVEEDEPEEDQ